MNLRELKELIELVRSTEVAELEIERAGYRVKIKRILPPSSPGLIPQGLSISVPPFQQKFQEGSRSASVEKTQSEPPGLVTITSPIVGTFYRAPAPDADFYVNVGDFVKKGQILCIVEAMKLMNEIETEVDGKVVEILVENTKTVEYGAPLFRIQPA
ncbi:MAG TPA: acetyl-CoA carboxylase biotin carboxyl carrier protein [Nitrospiria bacterium]|jgi:acetyl-CoA carboxylase biotin carboxyl carrier protein